MVAALYLRRPSWWAGYESCRLLRLPIPPVSSYYSDLLVFQQPRNRLVWSTMAVERTIHFESSECVPAEPLGLLSTTIEYVITGLAFWCLLLAGFASAYMILGYLDLWRDHHLMHFAQFSPSQYLLRWIARASTRSILSSSIVGKPKRYLTLLKVIRRYCISFLLAALYFAS